MHNEWVPSSLNCIQDSSQIEPIDRSFPTIPIHCFSVNLNLTPATSWYVTMLWIIYEYSLAGASFKSSRVLEKWEIYAWLGSLVESGKSLTKILHLKIKLNRLSRQKQFQSPYSQRRSVFVFALIKFNIHHHPWLRTCFYCILKHLPTLSSTPTCGLVLKFL